MRAAAVKVAVAGFFVLASVGWAHGLDPLTCGLRAAAGAVGLYVLASVLHRVILNMMVQTMLKGPAGPSDTSDRD